MEISDHELRALVRDVIQKRVVREAETPPNPPTPLHDSHGRFPSLAGGDADGLCLIEPSVRCSHCGYCQSLGH